MIDTANKNIKYHIYLIWHNGVFMCVEVRNADEER